MLYRDFSRAVALLLIAAAAMAADKRYDVEVKSDIEYGKVGDVRLLLDLASPRGVDSPRPGLVFIHGGGWAGGDKRDFLGFAKEAAARGYVAVTVNYRHAPKHKFPAQIEDSKCAVRWMRAHAKELKLDPERLGAIGGSAGGHLAMILGVMDKADGLEGDGGWPDQSSKVKAVVSYVGPTNLDAEYPPVSQEIVKNFIGGTRQERLEDYRRASPITYVDNKDAAMLLYQGTIDVLVPYDQAVQMATTLTKAGVPGRIELLLGEGHGFTPAEMERTLDAMHAFLKKQLDAGR